MCPRLNSLAYGKTIPGNEIRNIDSVITYSCNNNYKLVGSPSRTCLVDGTWSGNQPICTRKFPELNILTPVMKININCFLG